MADPLIGEFRLCQWTGAAWEVAPAKVPRPDVLREAELAATAGENFIPIESPRIVRFEGPATPDQIDLTDAHFVRASEPQVFQAQTEDWPATRDEARLRVRGLIGLVKVTALARMRGCWWDSLVAAPTPEAKLSCQWMIDELGVAIGLAQPHTAKSLIDTNLRVQEERRSSEARERALDRWRS